MWFERLVVSFVIAMCGPIFIRHHHLAGAHEPYTTFEKGHEGNSHNRFYGIFRVGKDYHHPLVTTPSQLSRRPQFSIPKSKLPDTLL